MLSIFVHVYPNRMAPPYCSWVSVMRVALGCSTTWWWHLISTNKPLEPATARLRAYWRPPVARRVRTITQTNADVLCWKDMFALVTGFYCVVPFKSQITVIVSVSLSYFSPFLLSPGRGRRVALHPFSSVFLHIWSPTPAAALLPDQSCLSLLPAPPAPLLEHREPGRPIGAVLHITAPPSSPPSPEHPGWTLPVDCWDRIVLLSWNKPRWMYLQCMSVFSPEENGKSRSLTHISLSLL